MIGTVKVGFVPIRSPLATEGLSPILEGLSLDVLQGELTVIVGPNARVDRRCCGHLLARALPACAAASLS